MIARLRYLWRTRRFLVVVFGVAVAALLLFGARTVTQTLYWMDPAHRDQPIAPWMTPRYVSMSYDIPPEVLAPLLYIENDAPFGRRTMGTIAAENGLTLEELADRITEAADALRAADHE